MGTAVPPGTVRQMTVTVPAAGPVRVAVSVKPPLATSSLTREAAALSWMVPALWLSAIVRVVVAGGPRVAPPVGLLSVMMIASGPSASVSFTVGTMIVALVWPALN